MNYNMSNLIPYISAEEYDAVAGEFLRQYYPQALAKPMPVPIEHIAKDIIGLDLQYVCLSEELNIYGMTIFSDGEVEIYNPEEELYEIKAFKKKTILIDPLVVKKTNTGCQNNTIAHECVHWHKHRLYFKMQQYTLPRQAKYCRCGIGQLPNATEEENMMENQAVGIAPRILMPKAPFIYAATQLNIRYGKDNWKAICQLADFYDVSRQSVQIMLEECSLI